MKLIRKSIVKSIGMLLTLSGIAVVFAACYGVLPQENYDYDDSLSVDSIQEIPAENLVQEAE